MFNKATISSTPIKGIKTSLVPCRVPRPRSFPSPPSLSKYRLPVSSLHSISNETRFNEPEEVFVTKPLAINFSTKSVSVSTVRLLETMRKEAREAHPDVFWEIIQPLPGIYGVYSDDAKVFRWVDPTRDRLSRSTRTELIPSLPGWRIEAVPEPDNPGNVTCRIEEQVRFRQILRGNSTTTQGNISMFSRRKTVKKELAQEDSYRHAIYTYLKYGLAGVNCKLYDSKDLNTFMVLCKHEVADSGAKPLLLLFQGNFGNLAPKPNLALSLYLADILGWRCEKIILNGKNPRKQVEKTVKLVQRWSKAGSGKKIKPNAKAQYA
jgi:hypothetical protein